MNQKELIGHLIHARTALKTDRPEEALKTIRQILQTIDPGQKIEMEMRGNAAEERR